MSGQHAGGKNAMQGSGGTEQNEVARDILAAKYEGWKAKFPTVKGIQVPRLQELIEEARKAGPGAASGLVLVDVRAPEEYEVSMIPSPCTLCPREFEERMDEFKQGGHTVVCYCTAGYRSGMYAAKLLSDHGFNNSRVLNLEGSILSWTHQGLPLATRQDSSTGAGTEAVPMPWLETWRVHVYSKAWGEMMGSGYEPVVTPLPGIWSSMLLQHLWSFFTYIRRLVSPGRQPGEVE